MCTPNSLTYEAPQEHNLKSTSTAISDSHVELNINNFLKYELLEYTHITSSQGAEENFSVSKSIFMYIENESYKIFVNMDGICCHLCNMTRNSVQQCVEVENPTAYS